MADANLKYVNDDRIRLSANETLINAVSPRVSVVTIAGGHRVNVVDIDGARSFDVMDGIKGDTGNTGPIGETGETGPIGLTGETGPKGDTGEKGDTGDTGPQGETGDIGLTGETGPKGDTGDTGSQGPKGDTGDTGPIGLTGETGPQGIKGDTGDTGIKGETGDTGPKGDTGKTGLQGIKGDTGDTGETGPIGETGPKGDSGPKGDTGDVGPKGDMGSKGDTGPKGDTGDTGSKGDTGDPGPKGDTGDAGPKGDTGDTGNQGPKGDTGDTGPQGPKGDTGDTGDQGIQGPKGDTGDTGDTGSQGPKGDTGDTGPQGPKGDTGDTNFTTALQSKLEGIAAGAEVNVQSNWNETDTTSDAYIQHKPTIPSKTSDLTNDSGFLTSTSNLDATRLTGTVPAANLPSYVDDVLEYAGTNQFPNPGETGKIYVDTSDNNTYRWTGTAYVSISNPLDYATQAEAETGTDNTKVMTPLRTAQELAAKTDSALSSSSTNPVRNNVIKQALDQKLDIDDYRSDMTWAELEDAITWGEFEGDISDPGTTYTENYHLTKPGLQSEASITPINDNMDTIDEALADKLDEVDYRRAMTWGEVGDKYNWGVLGTTSQITGTTYTDTLGLEKPGNDSTVDISTINDNYDIIDEAIEGTQSSIAMIESHTAQSNHALGSYFMLDNVLHKATSAIASGETITSGTNATPITLEQALTALNTSVQTLQDSLVYIKDVTASDGGVWRLMQYPDGTVKGYRWWSPIQLGNFSAWGNLYEAKVLDPVPYPITFSETPTVRVEQWGNSYTMLAYTFFGEGTRTQTPAVYAVRPDTMGNNHYVAVGLCVTGRAPSIR